MAWVNHLGPWFGARVSGAGCAVPGAARLAGVARWCDSVRSSGRKRCRKHVRYRANLDEAYTWVYGAAVTSAMAERRCARRRNAGVGVPASGVIHWPRYLVQKDRQVGVVLT